MEFEDKQVDLGDRHADHKRKRQFDTTDDHSKVGGDVAPSQAEAVRSGATKVTGNLHDNSTK